MNETEYSGEFFLPNSDTKYPGRIVDSKENNTLVLQIFGTNSIEGKCLKNNPNVDIQYQHEVILGLTFSPKNVTLVDCHWSGTKEIGNNLFQIDYKIQIVIQNIHVASINQLKLNKLRVCIPYLTTWYDGWKSLDKLNELNNQEGEYAKTLKINNCLDLVFIDSLEKEYKVIGKSYAIKYQKYLQFEYQTSQPFYKIISDIIRFTKLVEFATSKSVRFKLIVGSIAKNQILSYDDNYGDSKTIPIYFSNYSYPEKQNVYKHDRHQNFMLISSWKLEEQKLNELIVNWYSNTGYYHIYDFYLDSHNWFENSNVTLSNVMFNNRCLNLIQALEDFHRKTYSKFTPDENEFEQKKSLVLKYIKDNKELKQWANNRIKFNKVPYLKQRLTDLINQNNDIIEDLFGNKDIYESFPTLAKKYRDKLSHGNLNSTYQGNDMNFLFHSAQLLLTIVILGSLKLDKQDILRQLRLNHDVKSKIYELKILNARP